MVKWREEFSTGFDGIDEQHLKLLDIINDLSEAIKSNADDLTTTLEILGNLDSYVEEHFNYEQELMMRYDYPDKVAHMQTHSVFTSKLEDINIFNIKEDYRIDFLNDLLKYTVDWLIQHIMETDKKFATFLLQQTANV